MGFRVFLVLDLAHGIVDLRMKRCQHAGRRGWRVL